MAEAIRPRKKKGKTKKQTIANNESATPPQTVVEDQERNSAMPRENVLKENENLPKSFVQNKNQESDTTIQKENKECPESSTQNENQESSEKLPESSALKENNNFSEDPTQENERSSETIPSAPLPSLETLKIINAAHFENPSEQSVIKETKSENIGEKANVAHHLPSEKSKLLSPSKSHLLEKTKTIVSRVKPPKKVEVLEPFTEAQLASFYYNPDLMQLDNFVREFLKNTCVESHEFFELIDAYYKARTKAVEMKTKIQEMRTNIEEERKKVWHIQDFTHTVEGKCGCGNNVTQSHRYQQATFQSDKCSKLTAQMFKIRSLIHEVYQLHAYNSEVGRVRVQNYIYRMFQDQTLLRNVSQQTNITASLPHDIDGESINTLCHLQLCITVLFSFLRRGFLDQQFHADLSAWLDLMVSSLQRAGTLPDHFFVLNHLLRCPPGVAARHARYLQFPGFPSHLISPWKQSQLHHFLVMLANVTLPIRAREEFLSKFGENHKKVDYQRSMSFTMVDEQNSEEANSDDSWSLISEQDLVALFSQFPFTDMFAALVNIETQQDTLRHSPSQACSVDVMSLLSFASLLVKLLAQIYQTYNKVRYRQFVKIVTRTIRLVTQVVSDHWVAYRKHHTEVLGESLHQLPRGGVVTNGYSLQRLQVEFDHFLLKASNIIISSKCSGAIQFLSSMPFDAVSTHSMWTLLHMLIDRQPDFHLITSCRPSDLPDVHDLAVSPCDGIFLLTALTNVAVSRDEENIVLIQTCAKLILELAYINKSLDQLYQKNGQDLLAVVATKHPLIISSLVAFVNTKLKDIEKDLLHIFHMLPLHMWQPTPEDLDCIRAWLMESSLTSDANKLARYLLAGLNYGYGQIEGELFIPRHQHYMVGILLVEAYGFLFPDNPGGIKTLDYSSMGIIHQVGNMAVSSYNKVVYYQTHQDFYSWAWRTMLMLKLHETDVTSTNYRQEEPQPTNDDTQLSTWAHNMMRQLRGKRSYELDLETSPPLVNVLRTVESRGLLAAYVVFAMTKYGHLSDVFLSKGMPFVTQLHEANERQAVLRVVSNLATLFLHHPQRIANQSYVKMVLACAQADVGAAGYTDKLWQYYVVGVHSKSFAALITHQVISSSEQEAVIVHWATVLMKINNWWRDCSVLYLMDNLCKVAFHTQRGFSEVTRLILNEYKMLIQSSGSRGLLSSMMSWVSSNQIVSFLPASTANFCYFALAVLTVETMHEKEIGVWKELSTELLMYPDHSVEHAYKAKFSNLKATYLPPLSGLSIYRWGEQAMVTPKDHPFLPFFWQHFCTAFLRKPSQTASLPGARSGVGHRFFTSASSTSALKSMKACLYSTADHHQGKGEGLAGANVKWGLSEKEHEYSRETHIALANLYKGLALWLEESRLHDSNLFLSSLPEDYKPDLLVKVFQGDKDLWMEFFNTNSFEGEIQQVAALWHHSVYRRLPCNSPRDPTSDTLTQKTASERIVKRLLGETKPQAPVGLVKPVSPIPETSLGMLVSSPRLLQDMHYDLEAMVRLAKVATSLAARNVALDVEFVEMLPDLYEMVSRKITMGIPCEGKKHICTVPAQVVAQFRELRLRERTFHILEENRNATRAIVDESCEQINEALCKGVVHVERIIGMLSDNTTTSAVSETKRMELHDGARRLFYLFAQLIDGDVKRCPPAIQFFSTAVEKLGKNFIAQNVTEQLPLLDTILRHPDSVMFFAPHYSPMLDLPTFSMLYSRVCDYVNAETATTVFVLLSKFDMQAWLDSNPSPADHIRTVTVIMTALGNLGCEPDTEATVVLELMRSHLSMLLRANLNLCCGRMLSELLTASSDCAIAPACWRDFADAVEEHCVPTHPHRLQINCILESVHYLSEFFLHLVDEYAYHLDTLYERWGLYVEHISKLYQHLMCAYIERTARQIDLQQLWELTQNLFTPWIIPRGKGKVWMLLRTDLVLHLLRAFTECIRALTLSSNKEYCPVLAFVWDFYFQSVVPNVTEEQSLDLFHTVFITLPWSNMFPTYESLHQVLQTHLNYPTAFRFFGTLLTEINWLHVVEHYAQAGNSHAVSRLHQALFSLLVVIASNRNILVTLSTKMKLLFETAKSFHWNSLVLEETARSAYWYADHVEATQVLDRTSFVWSMLDLLHVICAYFVDELSPVDEFVLAKRNIYIKTLVKLLSKCSENQAQQSLDYRFAVNKLLHTIESTLEFNTTLQMQELALHACTALQFINAVSCSIVFNVVRNTFQAYLQQTHCGLLVLAFVSASSRSLASLEHLVWFLEMSIECHFEKLTDLTQAWTPVHQAFIVPELNKEDFVKEALKQQAILTLYTYNLHAIPRAQSHQAQLAVLAAAVQWCTKVLPQSSECEAKMLLFWLQIFDIVRMQAPSYTSRSEYSELAKYMVYLGFACQTQGEDKNYSGVLGAIGFGRKSGLTKAFRICAKSVHLFLACQMPSAGSVVRESPNAPGAIRNGSNGGRPSPDAEKFFNSYQGMLKNKNYAHAKEQIQWVIDFISNPSVNINDGCSLVAYLCQQFFQKYNFVSATIT